MCKANSIYSASAIAAKLSYERSVRVWRYVSTHDGINQTSLYRALGAYNVKCALREGVIAYSVEPAAVGSRVEYAWAHDGVTCHGTRTDFIDDAMSGGSVMLLHVTRKPNARSGRRYSYHITPDATALLADMRHTYEALAFDDISEAVSC